MKYILFFILFFCAFGFANENKNPPTEISYEDENSESNNSPAETIDKNEANETNETEEQKNPYSRFLPPAAEKLDDFLEENQGKEMELYQDVKEDGAIEIYVRPAAKIPPQVAETSPVEPISTPLEMPYDFCNSPRQAVIKNSILLLLNKPCEAVSLEDLKRIIDLPLSNLNITHLSSSDFFGLTNVTTLRLSNNRLTVISLDMFQYLPNLTYLDLSYNQIEEIVAWTLVSNSMNQLRHLNLSHNVLRELSYLDHFNQLAHLNLSHNLLRNIDENIFNLELKQNEPSAAWGNLITLNLSYNQIREVASNALNSLYNLVNLNISHNQISSLSSEVFAHLSRLINLNLSYNQLAELGLGVFNSLYVLTTLDVSHNELHSLEWLVLEGLNSLQTLKYANNPLEQIIINPQRDSYRTGADREWYDCLLTSCWNNYAYISINKSKYKYMKCRGNDSNSRCYRLAETWKQNLDTGYFLVVELTHNGEQIESVQKYESLLDIE